MNKKGFAISVVLYSMVILIIGIMYLLLGIVRSRYNVNSKLRQDVMNYVNTPYDMVIPTISYSKNGGTYSMNTTINVQVTDDAPGARLKVHVYRSDTLDSQATLVTSKSIVDYQDVTDFPVKLDREGVWTIYSMAIDLAGNVSDQLPKSAGGFYYQRYIVDATGPEINYSLAAGTYNGSQTVNVTFSDSNGISSRNITVVKDGVTVLTATPTTNSYSYIMDPVGTYTIYADATDNNGNNYQTIHGALKSATYVIQNAQTCKYRYNMTYTCTSGNDVGTHTLNSGYIYSTYSEAIDACQNRSNPCGGTMTGRSCGAAQYCS